MTYRNSYGMSEFLQDYPFWREAPGTERIWLTKFQKNIDSTCSFLFQFIVECTGLRTYHQMIDDLETDYWRSTSRIGNDIIIIQTSYCG